MSLSPSRQVITKEEFDAVLFDLDGVLTATAKIHAACWKKMFDDFLQKWSQEQGEPFHPQPLEPLQQLKFPLQVRGRILEVDILRNKVTYTLKEGEKLTIFHKNEEVFLTRDAPRVVRDVADRRA
jgi:beta-phosphoglucomutase-like phosphatase (HAD superfamily)